MLELTVAESFDIAGRGAAVFFQQDPDPWLPWCPHRVRVSPPSGEAFETTAIVEFARKIPPGEVMSLVFEELQAAQVPKDSKVTVLGAVDASDGDAA